MRCAKCVDIRSDDLLISGAHPLQDSMQVLKDSADAGCDICTLCWTRVAEEYKHNEKTLGFLLRGLDTEGNEIPDNSVWLTGHAYPSQPHKPINSKGELHDNYVWIMLGAWPEKGLAKLSIFAEPGTPAANTYSEIWTTIDRNPILHLDFARKWIGECQTKHRLCTSNFLCSERSEMPTRLVDLGEPQDRRPIRLVITGKFHAHAPYVALSYCWGASESVPLLLVDGNLSELQSRIDEEQLPKTHRDVFQLARDLGFRYVWIDALCIVQYNREEWERESPLTIVAGRAADAREGFVENRLRQSVDPCAISYYEHNNELPRNEKREMGKIWLSLPRSPHFGPVYERGWCFQEAMLSSRALVFGEEQLVFICQELEIREDGGAGRPEAHGIQSDYHSAYALFSPEAKPLGPVRLDAEEITRRWLVFWYKNVLWGYAARKFAIQDDVFAAICGLTQLKAKIRSRYLAGLWEVDMVRGLLWAVYPVLERERRMTAELIPIEVPSWSWVATQGRVTVNYNSRNGAKYHQSNWMVRPKYAGRWTRDTACHATAVEIKSCELEFFGRPRRSYTVDFVPLEDDQTYDDRNDSNQRSEDPNHIVASGSFDIANEKVGSCWCLPLTKTEGLILSRDDRDKFRRLGKMKVLDLGRMMSTEEVEVCLV
ncbi:heterokaryon incompatibility protein-domain-containing protein [Xylaria sp. FL0043]|nr:heterokaryon incompatibility protein-domain-containing protein [Xylaria sp. FL0043]